MWLHAHYSIELAKMNPMMPEWLQSELICGKYDPPTIING
jgi:hypothetical protein